MVIYKKDTKGKIRSLNIYANNGILYQESGLLEGKKVLNEKACHPKNIGKSNETTPVHQAELEAESKITEKLKVGYFLTIHEAENSEIILPMLAHTYKDHAHKIDWSKPVFVQPKLDGMRCLGNQDEMKSRKNTPIKTMDHIQKELTEREIKAYLDGELYAHGLSFQENMKLIKKKREGSENIKYHVYDLIIPGQTFFIRYQTLGKVVRLMKNVEIVPTYIIESEEQLKEWHTKFLEQGYEGTIIRYGNVDYKLNGRSANLLKYKDFKDTAAIIIDVVPSEARPKQGVLVCQVDTAGAFPYQFRASLKFSHKEREEILTNKSDYIGQTAEIRYFEETDAGLPRFPVCVGFRLDK